MVGRSEDDAEDGSVRVESVVDPKVVVEDEAMDGHDLWVPHIWASPTTGVKTP